LKYGKCDESYGINLEKQNKIIDNMDKFIKEMDIKEMDWL